MDNTTKLLHLDTAAFLLEIKCPNSHGLQVARPSGYRGIRLNCGCELLADERNQGWFDKPSRPKIAGVDQT